MDTTVTLDLLFKLVGFLVVVGGVYWRWQAALGKIDRDLQDYKLHVAETFSTKASVYKQFDQVSTSINELGKRMEERLDGMNGRFDRFLEAKIKDR